MISDSVIPLVASILYMLLFVFSLQEKRRVNRIFSVYLMVMALWTFCSFMWHIDFPGIGELPWLQVGLSFGVISWFFMCLLPVVILGLESKPVVRAILAVLAGLAVVLLVGNMRGSLIHVTRMARGVFDVQFGNLMYLFFALTSLSGIVFVLLLARTGFRTRDHNYRNRLLYLAVSNALITIGGLFNAVPALRAFPWDILFSLLSAFLMAYAIYRYHLMDISLVIRRGLAYSILTMSIATSYLLVILLFERLAQTVLGYGAYVVSFVVAVTIAAAFQPIRGWIQGWVDRVFFREKYDAQQMLHGLSRTAVSILDLDMLSETLLEQTTSTMHIAHASLYFAEQETGTFYLAAQKGQDMAVCPEKMRADHPLLRWLASKEGVLSFRQLVFLPQFKALWETERKELEAWGAQLFVPLLVKDELVGLFAFGPKLSEQQYTEDEKVTLATLANQAAVAIKNARLYEDIQKELTERVKAEQALEESEERYRHLFEGIEDAVMVYGASGQYLACNEVALRRLGYSAEEFVQLKITDVVHPDFHQLHRDIQDKIWAGETTVSESEHRCRDGRTIPVEINARRMEYMGQAAILAVVRDITERRIAEERLKASLREKDVLLREIHHRVKNNLQIVSYLLLLQAGYVEDGHVVEMFQDSRERIHSMALVHEKLYGSKDLSRIDFGQYANELVTHIFRSYRAQSSGITLKADLADVTLGIEAATPCGLIMSELTSNALKHAFPNGSQGEVHICLSEEDGKITLSVADNGIGFPQDVDFNSTESLGLQLVRMLVEQLDGTINLARNGGTKFHIQFTEYQYSKRI